MATNTLDDIAKSIVSSVLLPGIAAAGLPRHMQQLINDAVDMAAKEEIEALRVGEFIANAKERIYERAMRMGLSFSRDDIIHVKDSGHDIVWLKEITELVWDEDKNELVYEKRPVMWMEYTDYGLSSRPVTDGISFTWSVSPPVVRFVMPQLVIMRLPDGTIRETDDGH